MREKNRKPIASIKKLPQFTTMNVIDGQAGLISYFSLIFYSLTIDNILNIIILIILATVAINLVFGENGLIQKAQQAKELTEEAAKKEEGITTKVDDYLSGIIISEEGYSEKDKVNVPKLKKGMIPVYYDDSIRGWRKADETNENKEWYNYDTVEKKWANIVTVSNENASLREAEVGTEIPMEAITTFFVWIPRYAYSITSGYKQGEGATGEIEVTFLKGNTNTGTDGVSYPKDYDENTAGENGGELKAGDATPKIVHPGFSQGGKELTGLWVAKFEASGETANGEAVGNSKGTATYSPVKPDSTTYVKILPSKISWRDITVGESQYRSTEMSNNKEAYGWEGVNSHLIKNSEWGAVAYLCYSDYGNIPKTNGAGTNTGSYWCDLYTGAGPKGENDEGNYTNFTEGTNGYNTTLGKLASTTGNEYGIYDMAGGAWEGVATYLDNGNDNLDEYGKSTSNSSIVYFENGEIKSEYADLWEGYKVSEEEKSDSIKVGEKTISQKELWKWENRGIEYNEARKRLTEANFNLMAQYKGIGVNETTTSFSYYAPYGTSGSSWGWYQTVQDTSTNTTREYGRTWNSDRTLIGHASAPFVARGSDCYGNMGVLCTSVIDGSAIYNDGFRPVLVF